MMKQARQLQERMAQLQEELVTKKVTASSGGGMVSVIANGKNEVVSVTIDKEVVNPEDVEILQDLIMSAINEALRRSHDLAQAEMLKLTGGLNIPGLS